MTWHPPIDTGLSGSAYLSEELETHVDDLADAHQPGVYCLELSKPDTSAVDKHVQLWLSHFDVVPAYIDQIAECDRLLYVGAAKDMFGRITNHLEKPNQSTAIAQVYPIHSVFRLWPKDSVQEAFDREHGIALDLQHEYADAYVHVR